MIHLFWSIKILVYRTLWAQWLYSIAYPGTVSLRYCQTHTHSLQVQFWGDRKDSLTDKTAILSLWRPAFTSGPFKLYFGQFGTVVLQPCPAQTYCKHGPNCLLNVYTQWNCLSVLPEHSLDVDDGLGVCHVVLLSAHGALLVHNHQVVGVDYTTLEQVIQAGPFTKQQCLFLHDMSGNISPWILQNPNLKVHHYF